jgi:hypothetical protein
VAARAGIEVIGRVSLCQSVVCLLKSKRRDSSSRKAACVGLDQAEVGSEDPTGVLVRLLVRRSPARVLEDAPRDRCVIPQYTSGAMHRRAVLDRGHQREQRMGAPNHLAQWAVMGDL